jgi:hypothetical protein
VPFYKVTGGASFSKTGRKPCVFGSNNDPVAVALLLVGLATVELLAFTI